MLKLYYDINEYTPWAGAVDTYDQIYNEGKLEALEDLLEELYPDGIDETKLNDILWFESQWVLDTLGVGQEWEEEFTIIPEDTEKPIHIDAEVKIYDEELQEVDLYIIKPDKGITYVNNFLMSRGYTVECYIHDEAGEDILQEIYDTYNKVEG